MARARVLRVLYGPLIGYLEISTRRVALAARTIAGKGEVDGLFEGSRLIEGGARR